MLYTVFPVSHTKVQSLQQRSYLLRIRGIGSFLLAAKGYRAVNGSGVHIQIADLFGQRSGQG